VFEGPIGKMLMIDQGYVPSTCTLDDGPLIYAEISAGRSPCAGCNADRSVCKGKDMVMFRKFDDVDWMGYAGCTSSIPKIFAEGEIVVIVDDGVVSVFLGEEEGWTEKVGCCHEDVSFGEYIVGRCMALLEDPEMLRELLMARGFVRTE